MKKSSAKTCGTLARMDSLRDAGPEAHLPTAPRRLARCGALAAALALSGCGSKAPAPWVQTTPPVELVSGGITLRVDANGTDISLLRGDTVLLDFPADALELGTMPMLDDTFDYDPTAILTPTALQPGPTGLVWLSPTKMAVSSSSSTSIAIALTYPQGKAATLELTTTHTGSFQATLTPSAGGPSVAYFRFKPHADATEGFYGLGESYDAVSQRGKIRPMQLRIDSTTEIGYTLTHAPIPFLIGTRGWGLFVQSPYPAVFAVATEADDLVDVMFGTGLASEKGIVFHLFGEEKPIDLTRHFYEITGFPRLPARWGLGPWFWRHEPDQVQAAADMQAVRDNDLTSTAFWIDDGYFTAVGSFDFDPTRYTDAQALIDQGHALGYGLALWHSPYIKKNTPATAARLAYAQANHYYPPVAGLPLNPFGDLLDLTNPAAYSWWQGLVKTYTSMGIEGFILDFAEDVVPGLTNARNVWQFADGSDERTMHSQFQPFYHRLYAETLGADGGFLLCRHATYGDQVHIPAMWPGDLDATFAQYGQPADPPATYISTGGLPASIIAGLSLGPSGFPMFGADTGGYLHQPANKEVLTRWFEQTALSTVMQIYSDTPAWVANASAGYDAEMLGWLQTYTRLHLRLFPYEWTYAQNLATDGRAITRALGLAHPELGVHPNDVYMFGDSLLVAPVVVAGATSRTVPLPAGNWVDWWTGAVVSGGAGGATVTANAPLGTLPLYLEAGGIIPMLRPTIAAMKPVMDTTMIDSYATTPGVLWVRVAPGPASSFTVFDGAALTQNASGGMVTLSANDGKEFTQGVMFEVVATATKPGHVTDNGAPLTDAGTAAALATAASGWAYAPDTGGTVWVKTAAGKHQVVISP
jgi:alpha-D-xyloside xylohydrolase